VIFDYESERFPMATKNSKSFRLQFENLEARLLLRGGGDLGPLPPLVSDQLQVSASLLDDQTIMLPSHLEEPMDQAMGLPVLNSNPGAAATVHLDFTGSFGESWLNGEVKPFDMDGHPGSFNRVEKAVILEVFQRVSEDFAPFNINVTTAYYGPLEKPNFTQGPDNSVSGAVLDLHYGVAVKVFMNKPYNTYGTGFAPIGSFSDDQPNVAFVFSEDILLGANDGRPFEYDFETGLANTASHEAGHAFGLQHQRGFDQNGFPVEYSPGTDTWTPIMGLTFDDDRTTWADGPAGAVSDGSRSFHDELAVITSAANGFGYRPDDHGSTRLTASALNTLTGTVSATGIIEKMNDVDVFRFETGAGNINLGVNVVAVGPNLDTKIELRDSSGRLLAQADPGNDLSASIQRSVTAGTYYLHVMSHGTYGDLGQYTLTGKLIVPKLAAPASPIGNVSLNLVGPQLGASSGLLANKTAGVNTPPVTPTLSSQVSTASLVIPAASVSSPALAPAKPAKSVTSATSTAAIDHVFANGLDKFGRLF
jgi:hypothetical protein